MGRFTRREITRGGLAIAGSLAAPSIVRGQQFTGKVIKTVGNVTVFDPVLSTANSTWQHAFMVYDTLFGVDAQQVPRPQMVGRYGQSDDKLTWTFELRDGLRFHDGTEVTTADVIPSIRRWGARADWGPNLMEQVKEISAKDQRTFTIQLKERDGLVLDALGRLCFIMRKKEAETDPGQKINTVVGSGPFRFNAAETKSGTQYVYDRNPDYVPRNEAPSGFAGGKVVNVDRVVYVNMPDAQTALAALQAGEIDFYSDPPVDVLDQLAQDKNLKLQVLNSPGTIGWIQFNCLQPPFDNVKCRQALLHIVNQTDYVKANFANPKYYKTCASYFGCDTPMENDANTLWFKTAPNYAKAKQLLKEGGYDGRPVVVLQSSDWYVTKNSAEILAEQMRHAGVNVEIVPVDWAALEQRRNSKAPPQNGGWNLFVTASSAADYGSPVASYYKADGTWYGWPTDPEHEELRKKWLQAETIEERKMIARDLQVNAWTFVPHVNFGQWVQPVLMRANINNAMPGPFQWFRVWWNIEKA